MRKKCNAFLASQKFLFFNEDDRRCFGRVNWTIAVSINQFIGLYNFGIYLFEPEHASLNLHTRGPPEHCPLCEQEEETINHLLSACVFAWQFWHRILSCSGLQAVTPHPNDVEFFLRWQQAG